MKTALATLLACVATVSLSSIARAQDATPAPTDVAPAEPEPTATEPVEAPPATETPPAIESPPASTPPPVIAPPPASTPPAPPAIAVTAEPGRGLTISMGDTFSSSIRARLQVRATLRIDDDQVDTGIEIRTARLWWTGHVLHPDVRYGLQLALGANDFEPGNPSPIFDAFLELRQLRELNVRVGQFFVPFDRARTIREFALQTVDRTDVVRELTLDRDVGVVLSSTDFLGLGGALSYFLGVFGGDGRNRLGPTPDAGLLYTARVSVRPFGGFDDDSEGDLARSPNPRLAIGAGFGFNHRSDRPRSTTGVPYTFARFDYLHLAGDLVFKWAGISLLAEIVWRQSTSGDFVEHTDDEGQVLREWSRSGWGYLAQVGVMLHPMFEIWSRWEQLVAEEGTDPTLVTQANERGHGLSAGANLYLHGHLLKVQADWSHSFGDDFLVGAHLVRLQLDASF
ncbi:porin [Sandaracinus amylolyticus]|uniref:porin n=1 Tax=Sandaracinus amylolyticus TaxID=927083 RepID=UPI0022A7829D|nr:porin [Sandaracinus amylolyticus]UJR81764.1 Phosphate-selective porin [Sandaracinus amylolyticus]